MRDITFEEGGDTPTKSGSTRRTQNRHNASSSAANRSTREKKAVANGEPKMTDAEELLQRLKAL